MKTFIFTIYFVISCKTSKIRNKTVRESHARNKTEFVKYIPDIVVCNDINSLVYRRVSNNEHIQALSRYFSEIFNQYYSQESLKTRIIPNLQKIVSDFKKLSPQEKSLQKFYDFIILYSKDDIQGCKELCLKKYENDKIRKKFFEQVFQNLQIDNLFPITDFLQEKLDLSFSELKTAATKRPEKILIRNINNPHSMEFYIVMNLCVYSFWNLMIVIFAFFENYQEISEFLSKNNDKNLLYNEDSSKDMTFVLCRPINKLDIVDFTSLRALMTEIVKKSKFLKNIIQFHIQGEVKDICKKEILDIPISRFYCFKDTKESEELNEIETMNETEAKNSTEELNSIDNQKKKFIEFLNKNKSKKKGNPDNASHKVYIFLNVNEYYQNFIKETIDQIKTIMKKIKEEIDKNEEECNSEDSSSKPSVSLFYLLNVELDGWEIRSLEMQKMNKYFEQIQILLLQLKISKRVDFEFTLEKFNESSPDIELSNEICYLYGVKCIEHKIMANNIKEFEAMIAKMIKEKFESRCYVVL